ncbi:hypothetical protein [Methylobacterium haplocladii]|uniref:Uncharacterized protein n=1 Tax=Methylobacterium haplocladii TaxID=1176176 RepID=A0A512IW53_9HYPH|nr:hypothetical protein [Methylobacterium haplocladii]GEP01893.1 hypothetical protein MHA02_42800 [Methylobacterium haplocladii]GJD85765.1 hypothetical protein HPGCJGGD_3657 [Methylobacterium haplocladii]GLS59847.1 hypothetical protein GCM10007887_25200 [Methylobacterium haplocladii]
MTAPASRRSVLCGLTALPLVGGAALAGAEVAAAGSPALVRLVERYEAIDRAINVETDRLDDLSWQPSHDTHTRLCRLGGQLRRRIACHPSVSMSDVLLKARAYAATIDPAEDWASMQETFASRDGHAYDEDLAEAVVLDIIRLSGFPTAVA